MRNERRITVETKANSYDPAPPSGILPLKEVDKSATYFQVSVGDYGVVLPKTLNLDLLDGLTLVKDKASVIQDQKLARKIAVSVSGNLLQVTESFTRVVESLSIPADVEPTEKKGFGE